MEFSKKSVIVENFGGYDCLKVDQFELPPIDGNVEVEVKYCGMNFADLYTRQGLMPRKCPFILGMECSGMIMKIGNPESTTLKIGQHVICYDYNGGMYSNTIRIDPKKCFLLPDHVSFENGASLFVNYLTAYFTLFDLGNLRPGQKILIKSCAGGVGWAATQLAQTVNTTDSKITIVGTASKGKESIVKSNGVDYVIHYDEFDDEIRKIAPIGFDLIIETESMKINEDQKLLKSLGRIVVLGANNLIANERRLSIFSLLKAWWCTKDVSITNLILNNNCVAGLHLGILTEKERPLIEAVLEKIFRWLSEGIIKPKVDSVWPLDEIVDATKVLANRQNIGKVLLRID